MIKLAIGIVLLIILLIFVFQNLQPTSINFLIWSFEGSLSLLLILTIIITVSISFLAAVPFKIKKSLDKRNKKDIDKDEPIKEEKDQAA